MISKRMAAIRKRAKISQAELARRLNRSRSSVCEWESGSREPSISMLRVIAKALGADVTDFLV